VLAKQENHMNTRFVIWTIVAICSTGVAACGSDSPSIPTAPTLSTPPPAPPPLPPPRSLAVDLTGNYTLTFEVGSGCGDVPEELRIRTYQARIEYKSSGGSTDNFLAELSGATFHNQLPVWIEVTHGGSGSTVWLDLAPSDNVILEEPVRGAYFMIFGADGVASVQPTELSTISARFTGYFNYCAATSEMGPQNQCSIDTMIRSPCKAENTRWTLTRR
jgi:hypothetical protein